MNARACAGEGASGGGWRDKTGSTRSLERLSLKSGCVDNRVLLVDRNGDIVWQYGHFGVTGFGPNQLNTPVQNTYLPASGNVLKRATPGVIACFASDGRGSRSTY